MERRIRETYEIVTEESAEQGDYAEAGFIEEEGYSMEADEFDLEEGITPIQKAIDFLKYNGVIEASSSSFHYGIWYNTESQQDYKTGDYESRAFHLVGFTEQEEKLIFTGLKL